MPSSAEWDSAGVKLEMATGFPETEAATLKLALRAPRAFTLAVRRPSWAGEGFRVAVNGRAVGSLPKPGSYVEIKRTWKSGDVVELARPKTLRQEPLPDNPRRVAMMLGPLVLAGDVGPETPGRRGGQGGAPWQPGAAPPPPPPPAPALIAAERPLQSWLLPVEGKPGAFRTSGVGLGEELEFTPFYKLHRRRYGIYWDLFTPAEWEQKRKAYAAELEKQERLEAATVGFVQPGQMQAERDANQQGEETTPVQVQGRFGRRGTKWFSFDVPVEPSRPMTLVVTYSNDEPQKRSFDVLVARTKVGEQAIERRSPEKDVTFFDVEYKLPPELVKGDKVTVRFEATQGNNTGTVVGLRMLRADAPR